MHKLIVGGVPESSILGPMSNKTVNGFREENKKTGIWWRKRKAKLRHRMKTHRLWPGKGKGEDNCFCTPTLATCTSLF